MNVLSCRRSWYNCNISFKTLYFLWEQSFQTVVNISAVWTVSAGHRMVSEGWATFENACAKAEPGELPQLLHSLKGKMTPSPPCSIVRPIKQDPMDVDHQINGTTQQKSPAPIWETPIAVPLEGHKYQLGMKIVILHQWQLLMQWMLTFEQSITKKAFLYSYCDFTTYNLDSIQRYEKGHK